MNKIKIYIISICCFCLLASNFTFAKSNSTLNLKDKAYFTFEYDSTTKIDRPAEEENNGDS